MGFTAWYDHPVADSYLRKSGNTWINGKTWMWCAYDECTPPLKRGDRVRIRDGYDIAGKVYYYIGKDVQTEASVYIAETETQAKSGTMRKYRFLAAAIEPYPYSREERIGRAIEDFEYEREKMIPGVRDGENGWHTLTDADLRNLLFAILDAGV